jgi:HSP20 family protein
MESEMTLAYYQPWSLVDHWSREVEQILSRGFSTSEPAVDRTTLTPAVDIQEEKDRFVVHADMPGVAAKDIDVSAEDGMLTIRGTRSTQNRVSDEGFEHVERVAGTFLRRFTLPETAQAETIKARYTDGVLEIAIPKQPRAEPKRITVTVN